MKVLELSELYLQELKEMGIDLSKLPKHEESKIINKFSDLVKEFENNSYPIANYVVKKKMKPYDLVSAFSRVIVSVPDLKNLRSDWIKVFLEGLPPYKDKCVVHYTSVANFEDIVNTVRDFIQKNVKVK